MMVGWFCGAASLRQDAAFSTQRGGEEEVSLLVDTPPRLDLSLLEAAQGKESSQS